MKMTGTEQTDHADRIRGHQIHAMESNVPKSLIGYIAITAVAAYVLYTDWPTLVLVWGPIVSVICFARTCLAWRTSWRPARPMSRREEAILVVVTGLVSAAMAAGPTWVALNSEDFVCALMIMLIVSTMWGGTLVQATSFSSSVSFASMKILVWIACVLFSGATAERLQLLAMFAITVVVALDNVYRYAKIFESSLRQQITLEEHALRLENQTKAAEEARDRIFHLAHHDGLTGLANRSRFHAKLADEFAVRSDGFTLLTIDLDGFKPVNDRYGHHTGDALLVEVADRLRTAVGELGLAARLGGDEFAVATSTTDRAEIERLCRRLIGSIQAPYHLDGHALTVGTSIGVTTASPPSSPAEILRNADAALYRAKRDGRRTYRWFEPGMDSKTQERTLLLQDLREASDRDEFIVQYQPFVDAKTCRATGCEALIRWNHPTRGWVSPAEFIPLAEESGLIVQIGAWVMETACHAATQWPDETCVSVNVSPVQFARGNLPKRVQKILQQTGLPPHRLEIEVTEAVLVTDADVALDVMRRIRALGVKLALDDFGTGYSSLSYLRDFPFDKVKIDRTFIAELTLSQDSRVIVQGIRDIAIGLGMTITAEGVETLAQAEALDEIGCHELQGYLFSRAVPAETAGTLLRSGPSMAIDRSETPDLRRAKAV